MNCSNTTLIKVVIILALIACFTPRTGYGQKWEASWESLEQREYPQWFKDAKLGIFIHWGVYSVPSYSCTECYAEWFLRGLQLEDTMRVNFTNKYYGEDFSYRDFAPMFKAELFDPDEWANLFSRAGAKYVILVSKHHDGFALWPSKYSPQWNSMEVGPKRDLVGDLTRSIKASGLKMGLYYSLPEWNNELYKWGTDPKEKVHGYVENYMIPQFKEVMSTYKPSLIFSDGDWDHPASTWHSAELISWYYNMMGEEAIVNNRWGGGSQSIGFLTPEYSAGIKETDRPWAECRGLGRSFGFNRYEKYEAYMSPGELIHFFVKAVANGGGITLNVGPKADGQIPLLQQERLLQLGEWIKVNEEAIYSSSSWIRSGEEKDVSISRIDEMINFDWVRNTPIRPIKEDHFTVRWTGSITSKHTGEHTFSADVDDTMELIIDGATVINKGEKNGKVKLKGEKEYPIEIRYTESTQNAHIRLFWEAKGMEKSLVPAESLHTEDGKKGLEGKYASMDQHIAYTTNNGKLFIISLEWPGRSLAVPYAEETPSRISLLGTEIEIPFSISDGNLNLDLSKIGPGDLPCEYAWTFKVEF